MPFWITLWAPIRKAMSYASSAIAFLVIFSDSDIVNKIRLYEVQALNCHGEGDATLSSNSLLEKVLTFLLNSKKFGVE